MAALPARVLILTGPPGSGTTPVFHLLTASRERAAHLDRFCASEHLARGTLGV